MTLTRATAAAGLAMIIMTGLALEACQPPPRVVETDVEVTSDGACTFNAAVQGDTVQIRVSHNGNLSTLTFVAGVLKLDPDNAAEGEPVLTRDGEHWCATGGFDGDECFESLWSAGVCWTDQGEPTREDE